MDYVVAKYADVKEKSAAAFKIAVTKHPEKARAMLNLWFVPDFKPTFVHSPDQQAAGLDDVELLDPSVSTGGPNRYPVRMFDLDTKSLVDYPDIGELGQYCILSHSWKGCEVDYKYVTNARFLDFNRAILTAKGTRRSDIELVKAQCEADIREQADKIKILSGSSDVLKELELSNADDIVTDLLSKRVLMQEVERGKDGRGGLQRAKRELAWAQAELQYSRMEDEVFAKLLKDIGLEDVKPDKSEKGAQEAATPPDQAVRDAEAKMAKEQEKQTAEARVFRFFERNGHVREAVDDMIYRLQRWKSAAKIEQSIERAKEIFDRKLFAKAERRYLWIDSCCIDKGNSSEYIDGISAMGEWYANAEFCLVQLDTERNVPGEWKNEWDRFNKKATASPNVKNFREILSYGPEWAKRAWTLQELVMSKTTFYVNSMWELLGRPVESLGPYYYLCPFIDIYTSADVRNPYAKVLKDMKDVEALTKVLDRSKVEIPYVNPETHIDNGGFREPPDPPIEDNDSEGTSWSTSPSRGRLTPESQYEADTKSIKVAQKLIIILELLGVRIPRDIEMETAKSRMTQTVYLAATSLKSLHKAPDDGIGLLLNDLLNTLQSYVSAETPKASTVEGVEHAINILLKCLVKVTKCLVLDDRQYISKFGKVRDLKTWQDGKARSKFATHKVMSLACPRESTVATDRAYSLMGLLGVRFPTFSAEGLTKALSRLLDEVITSSNDVSVFNWSGKQFGNPIRGRSLYPSLPEAYKFHKDETRKMKKNRQLAELLHIKRYEVMGEFLNISGMLRDAISFAKDRQRKNFPRHWLKEILKVVKEANFTQLKPHITDIGKILTYIQKDCNLEWAMTSEKGCPSPTLSENMGSLFSESRSLPFGFQSPLKIPTPQLDNVSFVPKFMSKNSENETTSAGQASKSTIGGLKASLGKGFGKRDSGSNKSSSQVTEPEKTHHNESKEVPRTAPPATQSMTPTKSPKNNMDEEVVAYIRGILHDEKDRSVSELPHELREVLADIPIREFSKPLIKPEEIESMISPNPIVINNSGIQGFFDIQRVVVTMLQPEKLRRQIDNAISPHQKITAWCTISTGFAMVMVSFTCEKHILEKELDVINVVENKVLKEGSGADEEEEEDEGGEEEKIGENEEKDTKKVKSKSQSRFRMRTATLQDGVEPLPSGGIEPVSNAKETEFKDSSEETAKVSRMIKFVQEPNLAAIAGEWVLARISGVPGAKWFLCYLELSSTQDFYGQRIPTDEIDFRDASPEIGLLKCWEVYMMRKKRKLCGILQNLLESKDMDSLKDVVNLGSLAELAGVTNWDKADGDSDEESSGTYLDQNVEQGALALARAGAGLAQRFYELRAEQLEKNLNAAVLKKIPTHMQAALENLNDNKDLMPSMFHSARKIHMF